MYKEMTYEEILSRMLKNIPDSFDKREGSIVFDALAPMAVEMTQMYIALTHVFKATYAKESYGSYLDKRVAEMGIFRKKASYACRLGTALDMDAQVFAAPIDSEFIVDNLIFQVTEILDNQTMILRCQTAGEIGNHPHGAIQPLRSIPNLSKAFISDIIRPGEDKETDKKLYDRYISYVLEKPFAGNKAAYKEAMSLLDGVGPVKVIRPTRPTGTVSLCFLASDLTIPSSHLITQVKNHFDPEINPETITPLFQKVVAFGALSVVIPIDIYLTFKKDMDETQGKKTLISILEKLEKDYVTRWAQTDGDTVFRSHIESSLYQSGLLADVKVTLRGANENILLSMLQIPTFREVTFHDL